MQFNVSAFSRHRGHHRCKNGTVKYRIKSDIPFLHGQACSFYCVQQKLPFLRP